MPHLERSAAVIDDLPALCNRYRTRDARCRSPHPATRSAVSPPSPGRDHRDENGLFLPAAKRARLSPPLSQRVMLYARQEQEEVYTPLHVTPPTTLGLLNAVSASRRSIGVAVVELWSGTTQTTLGRYTVDVGCSTVVAQAQSPAT